MRRPALTVVVAALILGACSPQNRSEDAGNTHTDVAAEPSSTDDMATRATATEADVIAALRCHWVISSAAALRIVEGDAVSGIRASTRWFVEAQRRAEAAGIDEDGFRRLNSDNAMVGSGEDAREANRALYQRCIADTPAG